MYVKGSYKVASFYSTLIGHGRILEEDMVSELEVRHSPTPIPFPHFFLP